MEPLNGATGTGAILHDPPIRSLLQRCACAVEAVGRA